MDDAVRLGRHRPDVKPIDANGVARGVEDMRELLLQRQGAPQRRGQLQAPGDAG
jgi:hypothetical protein